VPLGFDAGMFCAEGEALRRRTGIHKGAATNRAAHGGSEPSGYSMRARLLAMKGLTDLIDCCARLGVNYELDIAGDGPERAAYQKLAKASAWPRGSAGRSALGDGCRHDEAERRTGFFFFCLAYPAER